MKTAERYGTLGARVALATIFVVTGLNKLAGPTDTAAYIASKGLPLPFALAIGAGALELAAGTMLVVGLGTRIAALALAAFVVLATVLFHNPIGLAGMEARMQTIHVLKNVAIVGGLLAVAVWGAGPLSLDARSRRARGADRAVGEALS
ncbi:MAG: DoxX family protein [Myxococcales bacterium]|nr:DoxX family protein [Myxococcales bacterium]